MKKAEKKILSITFILNMSLILCLLYVVYTKKAVLFRNALFSTIIYKSDLFVMPKEELIHKNFFIDEKQNHIDRYLPLIRNNIEYLTPEISEKIMASKNIIKKAKLIALSYSKNGGPRCGAYNDLMHNIKRIKNKEGCCSDHSEVFIALSFIYGLYSREVHNTRHSFNEIYDSEKKKWIWIDSQFAIMAKNDTGKYMSLLEMQDYMYNNKRITYDFFGNQDHIFSNILPRHHEYYDEKNDFEFLMLTLGNNVFTIDQLNKQYSFFPKPVRQLIFLTLKKMPRYIIYSRVANSPRLEKLKRIKYFLITLLSTFITLNLISMVILIKNRRLFNPTLSRCNPRKNPLPSAEYMATGQRALQGRVSDGSRPC